MLDICLENQLIMCSIDNEDLKNYNSTPQVYIRTDYTLQRGIKLVNEFVNMWG